MEFLAWVNTIAFALLGLLTVRRWWEQRTPAAAWVAAGFGLLGLTLIAGSVVPEQSPAALDAAVLALTTFGLLGLPYALFRFTASLGPTPAWQRRAADLAAVGVIGASLILLLVVGVEDPDRMWWLLLTIFAYWTLLSAWVTVRLWSAGHGRPNVARRRMRSLAVSAALLNVALILAFVTLETGPAPAIAQLLGAASAFGFYLAFSPPAIIRRDWRSTDEKMLGRVREELIRTESREEAAEVLLPRVAHLFGTRSGAFLDEQRQPITTHEVPVEVLETVIEELDDRVPQGTVHQQGDWFALRLTGGWLIIRTDPYAPFFSTDEIALLESVGGFLDLVLDRVDLLAAERQARARSEAASKELETLLYGISHDLRNPLVSILGYLEVLDEDHRAALDDNATHYLERLGANARYMDSLIGDLLQLSRIGRMHHTREPVDLAALARDIADEQGRQHPQATVQVGDLPIVSMNPGHARQLLTNLIANALTHSGRPDVTVRLEAAPADEGGAVVGVRDNGQGVAPEYRERVFGIFERLDGPGSGEGTGIGLAMCQRIVEQLGGRIWFADAREGADLRVQLPQVVIQSWSATEVHA